jgi:hypothetical protein
MTTIFSGSKSKPIGHDDKGQDMEPDLEKAFAQNIDDTTAGFSGIIAQLPQGRWREKPNF